MSLLLQSTGPVPFTNTGPSTEIVTDPSHSHPGTVASSEAHKRPKNLVMNRPKAIHSKNLRETSADIEDGSLPSTPECDDVVEGYTTAEMEALEHNTRHLIDRFLGDHTGLSKSQWKEAKDLATMKRVVNGVLEKHRIAYNGKWSWIQFSFLASATYTLMDT